jgi:transcriptional regulator with XRE-family HTH domain
VARNEKSAAVIGQVLRAVREQAGLTQQEVALKARMDRAYLSEVENGKRSLSVDRLLRLCDVLGVRGSTIIDRIEKIVRSK